MTESSDNHPTPPDNHPIAKGRTDAPVIRQTAETAVRVSVPDLYPLKRLDDAGLTRPVVKAQEKARQIIAGAAKILEPLGIGEPERGQFVMDRIKEGIGKK